MWASLAVFAYLMVGIVGICLDNYAAGINQEPPVCPSLTFIIALGWPFVIAMMLVLQVFPNSWIGGKLYNLSYRLYKYNKEYWETAQSKRYY